MKWRPLALGTTVVLAIVALCCAIALHSLADPERLKRILRDKAQRTWSRELTMSSVSLELWPRPTLHARGVTLANAPWAKSPHLIESEDVVGELAVMPLLMGEARLEALGLEGVQLHLEISPAGEKNWIPAGAEPAGGATPEAGFAGLVELRLKNATVFHLSSAQWRIDEATLRCAPGLREVRFEASGSRGDHALKAKGEFADLSGVGIAGATTNGRADFDWGDTRLSLEGRFPLNGTLEGHRLRADLKTKRLNDLLAFFGIARRPTAPIEAHVESSESGNTIDAADIRIRIGGFAATGAAKITPGPKVSTIEMHLAGNHLDWVQALLDSGADPLPPLEPDELFHSRPLAWKLLVGLQGWSGNFDANFTGIKMRNGIELHDVRTRSTFDGDQWSVNSYTTGMLGGTASGSLHLDGRRELAKLTLEGSNLLLEHWFHERGSPVAFKGGPMRVSASVNGSGGSIRDLARTMTGPVTIRMGRGRLDDPRAGAAHAKLMGLEAPEAGIEFECVAADLPFRNGRADRSPAVAAMSDKSYLVTSGSVDFREETYDLHGRLKPREAGKLSLATFAGDVAITGKIRHPHMTHDASKTPAEVERAAVALLTLGVSAIASTSADAAAARQANPCDAVF